MPLLKDKGFVEDTWSLVEDTDTPIPANGDILVPFQRLLAQFSALKSRTGRLGVVFSNVERAEALETFLPALALIVLPFPAFTDGRAYSLARRLRTLGFTGELRATGDVLHDQLQFMIQVGFDSFEVPPRFAPEVWLAAADRISLSYQSVEGAAQNIWRARHRSTIISDGMI